MAVLLAESAAVICRRALALAEHRNDFDSLEDGSSLANDALLRYDQRRRSILEGVDWGFARRRAVTAVVTGAVTPPDLPIALALPPEPLRIRSVLSGRHPQKWVREEHVFCETDSSAQVVYTRDIDNPSEFPPIFTAALEYLLASEFAMVYSRSINRSDAMLRYFRDTMEEADRIEAQEQSYDQAYATGSWVDGVEVPWLGTSRPW